MIDVYPSKSVHFVQNLAKASAQLDKTKQLTKELDQRVQKVKEAAIDSGAKKTLKDELEKLEKTVMGIASLEKEILRKEDQDTKDLKSQISELKNRMALVGTGHIKLSLEKISYLLAELTARMDTYVNIKTEREKRFAELEEKIDRKLQQNFREILELEKHVAHLEERYEEIKASGQTNQEHLEKIENRLSELRGKLIAKRAEVINKKEAETQTIPNIPKIRPELPLLPPRKEKALPLFRPSRPVPPPKMIFPQELKEIPEAPPIKHEMMFPELPPLPEGPAEEFEIPPPPRPMATEKKGVIGWLKNLFGK